MGYRATLCFLDIAITLKHLLPEKGRSPISSILKNPFSIGILMMLISAEGQAQLKQKQVVNIPQTWVSFNTTFLINKKWEVNTEINTRQNELIKYDYSNTVRIGVNYNVNENLSLSMGCVNAWTAPSTKDFHNYLSELRPYQQITYANKIGNVSLVNRLRNEERWQEKIVADTNTITKIFTDRVRYMVNLTIPFTKKNHFPSLVLNDEIFMQTGKTIVNNPLDQNRAYVGIKENLTKNLSFDLGYMLVDQQKSSGYLFNRFHILRLFVFYNLDFSKKS